MGVLLVNRPLTFGHLAALLTTFVWGTTFIATKVLLRSFQPVEILFIRFLIGYATLWLLCPRRLTLRERKQELVFAAAGFSGITLYYLLENIALTYTLASNVGVIISIAPFFTAVCGCLFLGEKRPNGWFLLGFAVAMVGIYLISFGGKGVTLMLKGDLLAGGAAIIWAIYSTLTKKLGEYGYPLIQVTRRTFFYGIVWMLPALSSFGFSVQLTQFAAPDILLNFLFLSVGASALGFVTWNFAVHTLGAVRTSVYIYMIPVITTITSALILRETITSAAIGGIALTLIGLVISEYHRKA